MEISFGCIRMGRASKRRPTIEFNLPVTCRIGFFGSEDITGNTRKTFFRTDRLSVSTFALQDIDGFMRYRNDADWML